jgi:hypothetical protein
MVKELEPKQMMKYQPVLLPLMRPSKSLFLLHNKRTMRLVAFLFRIDDTLFHDSENEGEMKALNEVNIPCCTIEDKGAVHEDETITHAEDTKSSKLLHKKKQ